MSVAESSRVQSDQAPTPGMGAILLEQGVAFRVWAPHADRVTVIGTFNEWRGDANPMERDENGYWYAVVENASVGDQYKYRITRGEQTFDRIDPYAREVTNSVGNAIVHDPTYDWEGDDYRLPAINELVIYEMHIGTFRRSDDQMPGGFHDAISQLPHLVALGVNVVEIMPVTEFAGDYSWGYNPAHIFAIEQAYGGPRALKDFVKAAHRAGIGVVMDVVYNHFGPSDLDLWQFDGWSENDKGGIYFYNDWRSTTPWGETRPDYGRHEVRQFIYDNAMMWLEEYHVDGLRYDMTAYIRRVYGIDASDIPEGWSLMQWINGDIQRKFPGTLLIAEDLQGDEWLTKSVEEGGAGFTAQWDAHFVHPVREVVQQVEDEHRDLTKIRDALYFRYNHEAFQRIVYSESHDEVANGKARVPEEITPGQADSFYAQKLSVLAAATTLVAPGIPMLFQGQELLEDRHFDDGDPLDWERAERFSGLLQLYHDLIHLRLNRTGCTRGLLSQHIHVHHVNNTDKVIAFQRWMDHGPGDDVVVVCNFANRSWDAYQIGFPCAGNWRVRLNSDWKGYSEAFSDQPTGDIEAIAQPRDGFPATGILSLGPYSVLVLSQDPS